MSFENVVGIASGAGVAIGLTIHFARQRKQSAALGEKVIAAIRERDGITLPELVTAVGMKDGFVNRGKLMQAVNPLVASGQVVQAEPPGTTMKNRLEVMNFRLAKK